MRPRPVVGKATVPDAVRRLLDKFDYPDRESPAQIIPILPTLTGGGGAPSIVVAASDATERSKGRADIICTGTDDHTPIMNAINSLSSTGGRVLLTEGVFNVSTDEIDTAIESIWLQGLGYDATNIHTSDTSGAVITLGNQGILSDLAINGTTTVGTHHGVNAGAQTTIRNCWFSLLDGGVKQGDSQVFITECIFSTLGGDAIAEDGAGGYTDLRVTNNIILTGGINVDSMTDALIANNQLAYDVYGSPNDHIVIVHNNFLVANANNTHRIEIDDTLQAPTRIIIIGNTMTDASFGGILLNGVTDGIVSDNYLDGVAGAVGIRLDLCEQIVVAGNHIGGFVGQHGIHLTDTSDSLIEGNLVFQPGQETDATYDGILLDANSDRNDIWNNKIIGKAAANGPRYGINISAATCNDNSYLGNRTGPAADYSSGAYNDAGTATVNTWPGAAAPQGDNLL